VQLDLSNQGKLSIADSVLIDKLAPRVQNGYNQFTEQLVKDNDLDELHLLLTVCSRNPYQSEILPTLCKAFLLDEKLRRGDRITLVIVEDYLMLGVVRSILDKLNQSIPIKVNHKRAYIFPLLLNFARFLKAVYWAVLSWLWPRLTGIYKDRPNESIVFVDNFVLLNSFTKENKFIDRYYTGYDNFLSKKQKQRIWYSPTLFGFKTLGQCLKMSIQSKKSQSNFLFQESWLTLGDYIHALYLTIILPSKLKITPLFMGYDIRQLLFSEVKKDIFSLSLVQAICKFKFIRNIKTERVEICQVVDWHENQNIDKALNLSFHRHYPGVFIKGYQGYVSSPYEVYKIPQPFEMESGVLPDQIHIISEGSKELILRNCPSLDVRVSTAFRFSYLYGIVRKDMDLKIPVVLIALPINISESNGILSACNQLHKLVDAKIKILVKHHPVYNSHSFSKKAPEFLNTAFVPTNDSVSDLLESVSLLISSASSICVEAESLGVPVAIYGNRYGVTMNPMIDTEDNIFYSQEQLGKFVTNSLQINLTRRSIKNSFFMDNGESAHALFVCG